MKRTSGYVKGVRRNLLWKYGLIICTVVLLTVLYLWEQTRVMRFDYRLRKLKAEIETLSEHHDRLSIQVISLSKGCEIVRRAENELKMIYPKEKPFFIPLGNSASSEMHQGADAGHFSGVWSRSLNGRLDYWGSDENREGTH